MMLIAFIPVFSQPTWKKASVLIIGSILCFNHRTVAACLRVMGLDQDNNFSKYHQVLNRAPWSGLKAAQILLGLLLRLVPNGFPIIIGVDETIERRKGKNIRAKGCYRDAVRSSRKHVVKCFGLKWICFTLIVPLPWNSRPWALPFLTLLQPSKKYCLEKSKVYHTSIELTLRALKFIRRQLKSRHFILLTDGGFAAVYFIRQCSDLSITLIGRLKINAALYDFPAPQPEGKKGPRPKKGKRLPSLKLLVEDRAKGWRAVFFVDAAHFVLSPFLGYLWCFCRLFIKAPAGRKRFNVLGALDAVSHQLVTVTNDSYINAQSVCKLLWKIFLMDLKVPVTLVLDNARYQKCKLVWELAEFLDIELLYLPSYSPNLNLIERLWKFVKKNACIQILRRLFFIQSGNFRLFKTNTHNL